MAPSEVVRAYAEILTHLAQQSRAKLLLAVLDDGRSRSELHFAVASFAFGRQEEIGHALSPRQAVQFPEKLAALQWFQARTLVCECQGFDFQP